MMAAGFLKWSPTLQKLRKLIRSYPGQVCQELPTGIWRKVQIYGGYPTELYGISPDFNSSAPVNIQVLLLPGNPGACAFYTPFLKFLHASLGPQAQVIGVSFLGHESGASLHNHQVFSLQDEIAHKEAVLWGLGGAFKGPTVVIGHSIGAYIALKAVRSLKLRSSIDLGASIRVIGLFPFLGNNPPSFKQKCLKGLVKLEGKLGLMQKAVWCLGFLPSTWLACLLSLFESELDAHAVWAAVGLMSSQHVRNVCHLGLCEFRQLINLDLNFLEEVAQHTTLVGTPGDHWFPDWQKNQIQKSISSLKIQSLDGFKHAFPVSVAMSESLSEALAQIIKDRP